MSKRNLTKLQKSVLLNCYRTIEGRRCSTVTRFDLIFHWNTTLFIKDHPYSIANDLICLSPNEHIKHTSNISRVLWALHSKGYIELFGIDRIELTKGCGLFIKYITLTELGLTEVKSLILSLAPTNNLTLKHWPNNR